MRMQKLSMVIGETTNELEQRVESTTPVMVNLDRVRNFYPRKPDHYGAPRAGTRLTFEDGKGMAVTEDFDTVSALFTAH